MAEFQEVDPIQFDRRALTLARQVMAERFEKDRQKFPPETTREEIIAAALIGRVNTQPSNG